MVDVEEAEKAVADLRQTVAKLEADVAAGTQQGQSDDDGKKMRTVSELITQALVKVDSIQISKDLATEALRDGDRDKSRKVAVLLSRRKNIVKKLNMLGDQVDQLLNPPPAPEDTQAADDDNADEGNADEDN